MLMLDVLVTPQQETNMARLDQFFARAAPPLWGSAALRLATLASAPPHPKGVETEGRKTIYRKFLHPLPWQTQRFGLTYPAEQELLVGLSEAIH